MTHEEHLKAEAQQAGAVLGAVQHLSWVLGLGWALAAQLYTGSWLIGVVLGAAITYFIYRHYSKRHEDALTNFLQCGPGAAD